MSNQKNQSSIIIEPWTISSCLGPHHICPKIWKNKFIEHEIHCGCNCHKNKNYSTNTNPSISIGTTTKVLNSEKKRRL
jgi:hypothetical protein